MRVDGDCLIAQRAAFAPGDEAVVMPDSHVTFSDYDEAISRCAAALDVHPGSYIGLCAPPSFPYLVMMHALWRRGAVAVPINPRLPQAARDAVVCERRLAMLNISDMAYSKEVGTAFQPMYDSASPAVAVLTSGTTSRAKAVVHSRASLGYNALGANINMPLVAGDRWLLSLPLYHVSGLGIVFRTALSGAALVIPRSSDIVEEAREHRITHLSVVSHQLAALVSAWEREGPLSTLKAVLAGGSAIPAPLVQRAIELGIPLHLSYGTTEMGSQITTTSDDDTLERRQTAGKCLAYRELQIDDHGEILVRGASLCLGYLEGRSIRPCTDADGWFHSGDMGHCDEVGRLTVIGRRDRMFISGGENIYPEEIEQALLALPGVERAAVVAVDSPRYGARPVAFVGGIQPGVPDRETIRVALAERLPRLKLPDAILAWPVDYPDDRLKIDLEFLKMRAENTLELG